MILTGMMFIMFGLAMQHQMRFIGEKPKDQRPGLATQLLGVAFVYMGWMQQQTSVMEVLWQMNH
ncbi:MAG: hypothetical protein [Caudoviricetes sp.]|nr:MAG: hypothetical protein [Caudoviricetes sp.]